MKEPRAKQIFFFEEMLFHFPRVLSIYFFLPFFLVFCPSLDTIKSKQSMLVYLMLRRNWVIVSLLIGRIFAVGPLESLKFSGGVRNFLGVLKIF